MEFSLNLREYAVTFIDLGEDAKHEFVYISNSENLVAWSN